MGRRMEGEWEREEEEGRRMYVVFFSWPHEFQRHKASMQVMQVVTQVLKLRTKSESRRPQNAHWEITSQRRHWAVKHNSVWIIKERRLKIADWPHHREGQQFCPCLFYLVLCFILRRIMWNKSFPKLLCFLVSRSAYTLGQTCINSQRLQLLKWDKKHDFLICEKPQLCSQCPRVSHWWSFYLSCVLIFSHMASPQLLNNIDMWHYRLFQ